MKKISKAEKQPVGVENEEQNVKDVDEKGIDVEGELVKEMDGSSEKLEKIDNIFLELLDEVKDSPEAKKEVLETLIKQMQQIAEQVKQIRDIEHLQETKEAMLANWNKLVELTKDEPELLEKIQNWGKRFVESKVLYYGKIDSVKDTLVDQSAGIRLAWNDMQVEMGKIKGLVGNDGLSREIEKLLNPRSLDIDRIEEDPLRAFTNKSPIEEFVNSVNAVATGYSEKDIDLVRSAEFVGALTQVIRLLSEQAYSERIGDDRPIDKYPDLEKLLNGLQEKSALLQKNINEASRIIKITKLIRDTHFLPEYNEISENE